MTSCPNATDTAELRAWLTSRVAETAGVPAHDIDPAAPFDSYGLGSAQAVSLSGELEERLGTTLSPTLLYEDPPIDELADALGGPVPANTVLANTVPTTGRAVQPEPVSGGAADDDVLCLTGMA